MTPADHRALLARLEDIAPRLPFPLTSRAMFGGTMAYADGRPFASLSTAGLALKLPATDQRELLDHHGARRLQYTPQSVPSRHYVVLPHAFVADDDHLIDWVTRSAQHALDGPP